MISFKYKGGITVFAGGLPRSIYANRNTVSILRGSNLDQAAAANIAAALRADSEGDFEDSGGEETFDQTEEDGDLMLANGLVPGAPVHVFDSDAPEHVCLDFPSPIVDLCPLGPAGGPASGLLVLCEEEIVAVDLLTPGWPILQLPYLNCLHASPVTAYGLFTQVDPAFMEGLESIGGKVDAAGRIPKAPGISTRQWPIKGGQTKSLSTSSSSEPLIPSNDLLLTGHENGIVEFWRLATGGCARRILSLLTGSLFDGEFGPDGLGDVHRSVDDEAEPWPPFRRVGLFDPFMDDVRAAVKAIKLVDRTLVVGGAAGQVSVWQLLTARPSMAILDVPITPEVSGFRWKGHAPLTLREQQFDPTQRLPGNSFFPIAVALCQPPSPITCLSICELYDNGSNKQQWRSVSESSIGVLVGMGSAHGFALMHLKMAVSEMTGRGYAGSLVFYHSTIPANAEALEDASVGDGWARRRTRELKNSLRDSFRRLKRIKSGRSTANSPPSTPKLVTGSTTNVTRFNDSNRVGLRKSVTRSSSGATRSIQLRGSPEAATAMSYRIQNDGVGISVPFPTGGEREICDRPTSTANTALVRCMTFAPPIHHRLRPPASPANATETLEHSTTTADTPHLLGSFFVGTSGGVAFVYALFADDAKHPSRLSARQATQVQLQHRAPIVTLRLIDTKTHCPLMYSSIYSPPFSASHHISSHHSQPPPPHLIVISEEQVRLFALPSFSLKQKVRITAKDGFRIKTGDIMAFGQTSGGRSVGLYGIEFDCVFTNNGGQAVVLSIPHLRRRDTIALLRGSDVLEINSIVFASAASTQSKIIGAPSLGIYQTAPGQLAMFDVVLAGQKCSALGSAYRTAGQPISRIVPNPSSRLQQRLVQPRGDAAASPSRVKDNGL